MPENDYGYLEKALPGFIRARSLIKAAGDTTRPLGFKGTKFDFYRFANRLRLATSFRGLTLDGFEEETALGYGALTKVFFSWSAFEGYTELADDPVPPYSGVPRNERLVDFFLRQFFPELWRTPKSFKE